MHKVQQDRKRLALVTGAGSGICAEVAAELAARGYALILVDRNAEALGAVLDTLNDSSIHVPVALDTCDTPALEAMIADLRTHPSVLVNGVGGDTRSIALAQLAEADLERSLRENLYGAFNLTRLLAPAMVEEGYGRIVNLASIAGRTYTYFSNAAYVAAKAALIGYSKQCAYELAPHGVTVNVVAHGPIATQRIDEAWQAMEISRKAEILGKIPMARLGSVAEAAHAVLAFCGEESGYASGAVLDVNGGMYVQ